MTEINHKFASHVTSIAFNLTLSKSMVLKLVEVKANRSNLFRVIGLNDTAVAAARALIERGLIVAPDPVWPGRYEMTAAGEHVFALLEMAGLVQRIETKLAEKETA